MNAGIALAFLNGFNGAPSTDTTGLSVPPDDEAQAESADDER